MKSLGISGRSTRENHFRNSIDVSLTREAYFLSFPELVR